MDSSNPSYTMRAHHIEDVNLYDSDSDSSYDIINRPATPMSSQSEANGESASIADHVQDNRPAYSDAKVQTHEIEEPKFTRAKPLTEAEQVKAFFSQSTGPTAFLKAIRQGTATLKHYLDKRCYDEAITEISSLYEYFCQQTDKHEKQTAVLQSRLDYIGMHRDRNFSLYRGEVINGEQKDEQIKTMQAQMAKLEQVKDFENAPGQTNARACESEKDKLIEKLRDENSKLRTIVWTKGRESDEAVRDAKYRCDTTERKLKSIEKDHGVFVKQLGEAHGSVTSSLLGKVAEAEARLDIMTKQFQSMERRATVASNMREGYLASFNRKSALVLQLQAQLHGEQETRTLLSQQIMEGKEAARVVEQRMRAAERIVGNVSAQLREVDGELAVVKGEKEELERRLEDVKVISEEMRVLIEEVAVQQAVREAEEEADDEDESSVALSEVEEDEVSVAASDSEVEEDEVSVAVSDSEVDEDETEIRVREVEYLENGVRITVQEVDSDTSGEPEDEDEDEDFEGEMAPPQLAHIIDANDLILPADVYYILRA